MSKVWRGVKAVGLAIAAIVLVLVGIEFRRRSARAERLQQAVHEKGIKKKQHVDKYVALGTKAEDHEGKAKAAFELAERRVKRLEDNDQIAMRDRVDRINKRLRGDPPKQP